MEYWVVCGETGCGWKKKAETMEEARKWQVKHEAEKGHRSVSILEEDGPPLSPLRGGQP